MGWRGRSAVRASAQRHVPKARIGGKLSGRDQTLISIVWKLATPRRYIDRASMRSIAAKSTAARSDTSRNSSRHMRKRFRTRAMWLLVQASGHGRVDQSALASVAAATDPGPDGARRSSGASNQRPHSCAAHCKSQAPNDRRRTLVHGDATGRNGKNNRSIPRRALSPDRLV
jgi:hypothetical protein